MADDNKRHGEIENQFAALEVALDIIRNLKGIVVGVRRCNAKLAEQIVAAASSVAANVAEGRRRVGRDRLHLFRIAAGSAEEARAHLRVAEAWGYVQASELKVALTLIDRELGLIWGLTH